MYFPAGQHALVAAVIVCRQLCHTSHSTELFRDKITEHSLTRDLSRFDYGGIPPQKKFEFPP